MIVLMKCLQKGNKMSDNWLDEYKEGLFSGRIPMRNPKIKKPGDPEYYYYDPRGVDKSTPLKDRKLIGVPTADTPNPALAEMERKQNNTNISQQDKGYMYYLNRNRERLCSPQYEGYTDYAYLDYVDENEALLGKKPKATIGCALNIDSIPGIQLMNRSTGQNFTEEEQRDELKKLRESYQHNHLASYYKDKSNIGISPQEHEKHLQKKFKEVYSLIKSFPNFSTFNDEQIDGLFDMGYNLGSFKKFPKMKAAIERGDWKEAAKESHRRGISEERNCFTANNFYPGYCKKE